MTDYMSEGYAAKLLTAADLGVVKNLRDRWPVELKPHSDEVIDALYRAFATSDEYGNNDELFPLWFEMLPTAGRMK
jgi:hypothetical protein